MIRNVSLIGAAMCSVLTLCGSRALGAGTTDVRVTAPSIDGALLFSDGSWSWRCTSPVCTVHAYPGHTLTVTAQSGAASAFQWWSGACSGTQPTCSIAVGDASASAGARFSRQRLWLPTFGAGSISTSTPGSGCGTGCSDYPTGQQVVLSTTASPNWRMTAWGGSCANVPHDHRCVVAMSQNTVVAATFEAIPRTGDCPPTADCGPITSVDRFTVRITGQGTVTAPKFGNLPAFSCRAYQAAQCALDRPVEHWIYVTAVGVHFLGWSDARCRGQGNVCRFYDGTELSRKRGFDLSARFG